MLCDWYANESAIWHFTPHSHVHRPQLLAKQPVSWVLRSCASSSPGRYYLYHLAISSINRMRCEVSNCGQPSSLKWGVWALTSNERQSEIEVAFWTAVVNSLLRCEENRKLEFSGSGRRGRTLWGEVSVRSNNYNLFHSDSPSLHMCPRTLSHIFYLHYFSFRITWCLCIMYRSISIELGAQKAEQARGRFH